MSSILKFKRGTTAEIATAVETLGELVIDTSKKTVVVMDGTTPGGTPLATTALANSNAAGLMSASDKTKLNGLSNYTLPTASTSTIGGVRVDGSTITISNGIISASVPNVNLDDYYTSLQTDSAIATAISNISSPDLSGYVQTSTLSSYWTSAETQVQINTAVANGVNGLASVAYVDQQISSVQAGTPDLSAASINALADVDTTSAGHVPTDGQALVWNQTHGHWMPGDVSVDLTNYYQKSEVYNKTEVDSAISGATVDLSASSVDALVDVDTTTTAPVAGQALVWDGLHWVPGTVASSGGTTIANTVTLTGGHYDSLDSEGAATTDRTLGIYFNQRPYDSTTLVETGAPAVQRGFVGVKNYIDDFFIEVPRNSDFSTGDPEFASQTVYRFSENTDQHSFFVKGAPALYINETQIRAVNRSFVGDGSGLTNLPVQTIDEATPIAVGTVFGTTPTSTNNTGMGANALRNVTTGDANTAVGKNALRLLETGTTNTAIGFGSLENSTASNNSIAIGVNAGRNQQGDRNTSIGVNAGIGISQGINNTAIGYAAMALYTAQPTDGTAGVIENNMAIGNSTMGVMNAVRDDGTAIDARYNVGIGTATFQSLKGGDFNSAIGGFIGNSMTEGVQNTFIGYNSAENVTSGNNNVFIGYQAAANGATDLATKVTANNQIVIGNQYNNRLVIPGLGIDTASATDGQILAWDAANNKFAWTTNGGGGYILPTASTTVLGGVKVDGSTITVDGDGVISSTATGGAGASNVKTLKTVSSNGQTGTMSLVVNGSQTDADAITVTANTDGNVITIGNVAAGVQLVSATFHQASGLNIQNNWAVQYPENFGATTLVETTFPTADVYNAAGSIQATNNWTIANTGGTVSATRILLSANAEYFFNVKFV